MFWGLGLHEHQNACWLPMGGGFRGSSFEVHVHGVQFPTSRNKCRVVTKTCHVSVLVYFGACATCVWKLVPGCLEVNNTFTTCH